MKIFFTLFFFVNLVMSSTFAQDNSYNTLLEEIHDKDQVARHKLIEFEQKEIADSIVYYY